MVHGQPVKDTARLGRPYDEAASVPLTPRLGRFVLVVCSSVAGLALAEALLRAVPSTAYCRGYCVWPPHLDVTLMPAPDLMPGISGPSRFTTNSYGLRADEPLPEQTDRILTIGGSTTDCRFLDQSETWSQQLQFALNRGDEQQQAWVGNAGMSGTTTRHHILVLERLPLAELRITTVVLLAGVNDLSIRLSHDADDDPRTLDGPETQRALLAEAFKIDNDADAPFYRRTALWQWASRGRRVSKYSHAESIDAENYRVWRDHRRHAREIRSELPDLSLAVDAYSRNLRRIIDLSAARGVRLVLMTQPAMWRADLPRHLEDLLWLGGVGDFQEQSNLPYYSAAALAKGMKAYNDAMLRTCDATHTECLDLAARLASDPSIFYDDVHFNERGARQVAQILAEYLQHRHDRG
jgi:lysophospholipase L1-like esterase